LQTSFFRQQQKANTKRNLHGYFREIKEGLPENSFEQQTGMYSLAGDFWHFANWNNLQGSRLARIANVL
jgi:hypothetical protein